MRWTRFRSLFGLEPETDVDHELRFHIEMRTRELIDRGESPERARQLALQRFGDYQTGRRECLAIDERRRRAMLGAQRMMELRQDVGYALRTLRRTPGFTVAALVTLALGIGANTAIFSVVHGVLVEALPFRDADRLYRVRMLRPDGTTSLTLSAPDFVSLRQESRAFERVEAYTTEVATLLGNREPREIRVARVSDGLFDVLGLTVTAGRGFGREEHAPGSHPVVVLDHGFCQRELGGNQEALGRSLIIAGRAYQVVGVLPRGARLPEEAPTGRLRSEADVYLPLVYDETFSATTATRRRNNYLGVFGRAAAAATSRQVDDDLHRVGLQLQASFPDTNASLTFNAISPKELMLGDIRQPLLLLLGAVGFLLLVACANVANLLLARGSARRTEFAVRTALGAGRARLLRQHLTEALLLSTMGGAAGLIIASWGTRALAGAQPTDIPRLQEIAIDSVVIVFTTLIVAVTTIIFGILPGRRVAGVADALRDGGRGANGSSHRFRATLVVVEVALAMILLTGAGLLVRSLVELTRVDPGFETARAVAFRTTFQGTEYAELHRVSERVLLLEERLRRLPGVTVVGSTTVLPLGGISPIQTFRIIGAPPSSSDVTQEIGIASVSPDYFKAVGVPLHRGRNFTNGDTSDAPLVGILNEAAARQWFPNQDPIGQRLQIGGPREIVGIVGNVLQRHPGQPPAPQLFVPFAQRTARSVRLVVRADGDLHALHAPIRAAVRDVGATLPIADFATLEELVGRSITQPRFVAALLTLFAGIALVVAATGIFGVTSYTVTQRRREIAVRMALGATVGEIVRSILGRAMAQTTLGAATGLVGALSLGRLVENQLFGVALFDPVTTGVVVVTLFASAAVACLLPAWRAAVIDPASALRQG